MRKGRKDHKCDGGRTNNGNLDFILGIFTCVDEGAAPFFATRSEIRRVCAVALAGWPELYWLAICSGSSLGKLSRGEARHFKERREGGENVKRWHKRNYVHTFQRDVR